ncbi:MAG: hypothetical protein JSR15_01390 [Proteobacteria bacterium]|nr:hypothetical protein [Pseudomonadota bacterium]
MARNADLWKPIVVAALIAGTADLAYACIHIAGYYHMSPQQIFQSIARGLLGAAAMQGGWSTALLGIALEYLLTLIMASVYVGAATRIADLRRYWWLLGPCYGVVVMVAMYTVVLPLSAVHSGGALPDGPRGPDGKITDHQMLYATILVHLFIVGLVISACARFLWPRQAAPTARS